MPHRIEIMNLQDRIKLLDALGRKLTELLKDEAKYNALLTKVANDNPWFIAPFTKFALSAIISRFLDAEKLKTWVSKYNISHTTVPKNIALTMAGNIPLVGFHDFLCTFVSGHKAMIKLSSKDKILLPFILDLMLQIDPAFSNYFELVNGPHKKIDAVIATGSNNTSRYFEYYFGKYPNIIRKNKNSVAIITGNESQEELEALGQDVFLYFGMGCRSVSKILVPKDYDIWQLKSAWKNFDYLMNHHKYANNYIYNKSIMMVNQEDFIDFEYLLVQQNINQISSPVGMLYYDFYKKEQLNDRLLEMKSDVQVFVSVHKLNFETMLPGQNQLPALDNYADNIDTMHFLNQLNQGN